MVVSNAVMFVAGVMIMWCSFDVAGRDWVKLKKYQKSLKNQGCVSLSLPQVPTFSTNRHTNMIS